MPRDNKPFYRSDKGMWYARIAGRRISLGVRDSMGERAAFKQFCKLQIEGVRQKQKRVDLTVSEVCKAFLQDAESRISKGCYRNYELFSRIAGEAFTGKLNELTTSIIERSIQGMNWSNSYKHNFIGFLITVSEWAVKQGLMRNNPIKAVKRPSKESRSSESVISEEEHKQLIDHADPDFKAFLQLLWLTGSRPSEIAGLTVEQVTASTNGVIQLTDHKTAYRGKQRLLILNDEAMAICKQRTETRSTGYLFSGINGKLTANAIGGRLSRLCIKAGIRNCIAYGYRHSFATDALCKGLPDGQVAALLGHASTTMLYKHYSHLTQKTGLLKDALKRIR